MPLQSNLVKRGVKICSAHYYLGRNRHFHLNRLCMVLLFLMKNMPSGMFLSIFKNENGIRKPEILIIQQIALKLMALILKLFGIISISIIVIDRRGIPRNLFFYIHCVVHRVPIKILTIFQPVAEIWNGNNRAI